MNDSMFMWYVIRAQQFTPERPPDRGHRRKGQPGRLEVGGQHDQDHNNGHDQADLQALEHLPHRQNLSTQIDLGSLGRLAGAGDRRIEVVDRPSEVFPLDVGRQAQVALHVVAVDFAGHLAAHDAGHVANQERRRGV